MIAKSFYILPLMVLLAACSSKPAVEQASGKKAGDEQTITLTPAQYKNADIAVGQAEQRPLHRNLRVNGIVDVPPEHIHTISFPMGGYIRSIALLPGMQLHKGQVMATVEDQGFVQLQQDYLTAKARLHFDHADFDRQNLLSKTESNSQRVVQQATTAYESQKILVKALSEKLKLIGINPDRLNENTLSRTIPVYAPVTGYVSKVNVNQGKYVSPTDVLFELIDPSELHINLQVFENDARSLQPGQVVTCTLNNRPDQQFSTRITYIAHNLDENRAVAVHCHLEQKVPGLMAGNFISGEIQRNNEMVTAVPDGSVVTWQGKPYVFITRDSKVFRLTPVTTGAGSDGYTALLAPVPAGQLVTRNAYVLLTMLKNKSED